MQIQSSAPPTPPTSPLNWVQKNLFSTWYNSILTLVCLAVIVWGLSSFISWVVSTAQWEIVGANLRLFFVGRFPHELYWRVWTALGLILSLAGICWGYIVRKSPLFSRTILFGLGALIAAILLLPIELSARLWILAIAIISIVGYAAGRKLPPNISPWLTAAWGLVFIVNLWLIGGGLGLTSVPTNVWSGLLLTLLTAICGIVLSFPFGVVRAFSILYIEVVRGLPLIGILFLAQVMLPLFLPPYLRNLDRVLRAIAGLVLFSAAYLAENIRGGLQAIPRGQFEAAKALGLSPPLVVLLIVLPQALKAVIPAIVGQFIGLLKDTSLLSLFGLLELTGISRSILAQPQFLGRYAEVYLFIGLLYWLFCYGMSTASRYLERKLNVS